MSLCMYASFIFHPSPHSPTRFVLFWIMLKAGTKALMNFSYRHIMSLMPPLTFLCPNTLQPVYVFTSQGSYRSMLNAHHVHDGRFLTFSLKSNYRLLSLFHLISASFGTEFSSQSKLEDFQTTTERRSQPCLVSSWDPWFIKLYHSHFCNDSVHLQWRMKNILK